MGNGPQILRHAIDLGVKAAAVWIGQALLGVIHPERVADPQDLIPPKLLAALPHARRISETCGDEINNAVSEMRFAIPQIQSLRQTTPAARVFGGRPIRNDPNAAAGATGPLGRAQGHLREALKEVENIRSEESLGPTIPRPGSREMRFLPQ